MIESGLIDRNCRFLRRSRCHASSGNNRLPPGRVKMARNGRDVGQPSEMGSNGDFVFTGPAHAVSRLHQELHELLDMAEIPGAHGLQMSQYRRGWHVEPLKVKSKEASSNKEAIFELC